MHPVFSACLYLLPLYCVSSPFSPFLFAYILFKSPPPTTVGTISLVMPSHFLHCFRFPHHLHVPPPFFLSSPKAGEHGIRMQLDWRCGRAAGVVPAGCLLPQCQGLQLGAVLHQECSTAARGSSKEPQNHALCIVSVNCKWLFILTIRCLVNAHILYSWDCMCYICYGEHYW